MVTIYNTKMLQRRAAMDICITDNKGVNVLIFFLFRIAHFFNQVVQCHLKISVILHHHYHHIIAAAAAAAATAATTTTTTTTTCVQVGVLLVDGMPIFSSFIYCSTGFGIVILMTLI
jgi:hypothetical protein